MTFPSHSNTISPRCFLHPRYSGYSMAGPPGEGQLIVCFGDAKRGQLGVEATTGARRGRDVWHGHGRLTSLEDNHWIGWMMDEWWINDGLMMDEWWINDELWFDVWWFLTCGTIACAQDLDQADQSHDHTGGGGIPSRSVILFFLFLLPSGNLWKSSGLMGFIVV